MHAIGTENQWADIFTKPLSHELFNLFQEAIMGWSMDVTENDKMSFSEGVCE